MYFHASRCKINVQFLAQQPGSFLVDLDLFIIRDSFFPVADKELIRNRNTIVTLSFSFDISIYMIS